ncbi:MAG: hypothetical protein RIF46_01075 [Cyclobacteriaceae bacterium]
MIWIFIASFSFSIAQNESLISKYEKAYEDEKLTKKIIGELEKKSKLTSTEKAYLGALNMLMANHVGNPFSKISYFQDGKELLESATKEDADNIEIRYLRFINQVEIPSILGYKSNIEEDKKIILDRLSELSGTEVHERMVKYLQQCPQLTNQERQKLIK